MNLKYFMLVLALVGALFLFACSSNGDNPTDTEQKTEIDTSEESNTPESETVAETEEETVAETEPPEEILVPDFVLNSPARSPMIYTPLLKEGVSIPYAKSVKTLDELTAFAESLNGTFDLNENYLQTSGAFLTTYNGFNEEIKNYNSAYFKKYALVIAAVEVPAAMGYLPTVENVEYTDNKISVTVTADPYDNIKSKVYHILISIPLDKYSENVEIIFNQREQAQKGTPVSIPFEAKTGGQIMHDVEHMGYFPQFSNMVRVFETKENFDKYLNDRHFSGYVKNDTVGTTFMEGASKYDEKFFDEKSLIIFGNSFTNGILPEITSVTMDNELLRVGYKYNSTDHWVGDTITYYCFIEVDKTYIPADNKDWSKIRGESGMDGTFAAESEVLPEIDLSIPVFQYKISPIIDDEQFKTQIYPRPLPISSRQQLMEFKDIKSFKSDITTDTYNKSFDDIANEYTDDFFKDKMLLLLRIRINKTDTFGINEVRITNDRVNVALSYPEAKSSKDEETDTIYVFLELPVACYSPAYDYTATQAAN